MQLFWLNMYSSLLSCCLQQTVRFLLLGNGGHLPKDLWQTACHSLNQSLRLTLQPLKMVLSQFEAHRHGLGGREDRVKITCKKNMTVSTAFRILHLAKQVIHPTSTQYFNEHSRCSFGQLLWEACKCPVKQVDKVAGACCVFDPCVFYFQVLLYHMGFSI